MNFSIEDQYQSVHRAFGRMSQIATNIGNTVMLGDPAAVDATRDFFIQCYHLKDHLKRDQRFTPADVENFVGASSSLVMAADLCNAFKHGGAERRTRSGKALGQINMAYILDLPHGADEHIKGMITAGKRNVSDGDTVTLTVSRRVGFPRASAKVMLTIGGQAYDAVTLASDCMADWKSFLTAKNIQCEDA